MTIQVENKSDLSGAMLVIRFPEKDLDAKALYTIQADQPVFLVPFRYRCVDGEAECTYQLGNQSKLLYRCSSKAPGELTRFWELILQPLLDCSDWFLKPFSFVMDPQYLFLNKEGTSVSYLYVPSRENCSDYEMLRSMTVELAKKNPSTDTQLEVKILRTIMQDFQPKTFLEMLRETQPAVAAQALIPQRQQVQPPVEIKQSPPIIEDSQKEKISSQSESLPEAMDGEIKIDLSGNKKEKKSLFGLKEGKKKKEKVKKEGGLFGRKKEVSKEIVLGAAAEQPAPHKMPQTPQIIEYMGDIDLTTIPENSEPASVHFRLVGDPSLPRDIPVSLETGGIFTIGRFDVSVGRRQSGFEFEPRTKAVSRHHAAVERTAEGYFLVDLGSSAGTYVNGEHLVPNVPHHLSRGCRVAFGTAGADYIWEE